MIIRVDLLVETDDELIVRVGANEMKHSQLVLDDIEQIEGKHFDIIMADAYQVGSIQQEFSKELEHIINKFSRENGSNTPDFVLANYLIGCLETWNSAVSARERWYGRKS